MVGDRRHQQPEKSRMITDVVITKIAPEQASLAEMAVGLIHRVAGNYWAVWHNGIRGDPASRIKRYLWFDFARRRRAVSDSKSSFVSSSSANARRPHT